MARTKRIEIIGEQLRESLNKRGILLKTASVDMGFSANYLSEAVRDDLISRQATVLLDKLYGVKVEEYTKREDRAGFYEMDDIVEELKTLNGTDRKLLEELEDIRYALNVLATTVSKLTYELCGEQEGGEADV